MSGAAGGGAAQAIAIPLIAIAGGLAMFGAFVFAIGQDPLAVMAVIVDGAFASTFSWQNTLLRAAPLVLTGLAVAIPAQVGLVVIGAEGTLALGGLAAAWIAHAAGASGPAVAIPLAMLAGMLAGAGWTAATGALRAYRGLNETIASLLLSYIAIALFNHLVEGPLRDPGSLNKPSTPPVGDALMLPHLPGTDLHWGLAIGVAVAFVAQLLVSRTTLGFAMRVAGGNVRAARLVGLPVAGLLVLACALGGSAAGLAGAIEVLAVHGAANASLLVGYGYTGILVAFIARHQPLAVVPVAVLLGGISAAGSLLQRRLDLPDATTQVLQGLLFVSILASEALYGRLNWRIRPVRVRADLAPQVQAG
jgi:simple sugar transport system permease protein